jgi:hypothetical protein
MNPAERDVARGLIDLAGLWLFLQYVLPVLAVVAIAYMIYRAVKKPHVDRHTFASSEPEDRLDHDDVIRRNSLDRIDEDVDRRY